MKALVASGQVEFPDRVRQIGIYAFQNPHQMAFLTVREIGKITDTSASSVQRFAKTFGFSDYTALRKVFRNHIANGARHRE